MRTHYDFLLQRSSLHGLPLPDHSGLGRKADRAVFAEDLFQKPPGQVFSVPVEMTMVNGEVLFDARRGLGVSCE